MTIRSILLCIATCTLASVAGGATTASIVTNEDNVCSSTECLNVASELSKMIDPTVDPCEDFYEFACGTFRKSIPANVNLNYGTILERQIEADVRQLMAANVKPNEPKAFKLVKRLYKSCMNTAEIEAKGFEPLRNYLRTLGGWPVVEGASWNGQNFDWRRTIYKFRRDGRDHEYYIGDGVGYLIRFVVERNETHPSNRLMALQHPHGLLLRRAREEDFNETTSFLRTYYDAMVHIVQMLGADDNRAMSEIRETLSFEIELNQIKLPKWKLDKLKEYNPMTIAQLNEKYPSVPWMTYIRQFVPSSMNVTNEEIINVPDIDYYVKLEALMAKTPKRVQANYVMSRVAVRNAVLSTEEMRTTVYRILAARSGASVKQDRASYCEAEVSNHLWHVVIAMYATKFFNKEAKDAAMAIAANLKWELEEKLRTYNGVDETTKRSALDKAAGLITHVGYPDWVLDLPRLEEWYGSLEFTEDDYFGNMDKFSNYDHEMGIKKFEAPLPAIDEGTWLSKPNGVYTAHYPLENRIQIAAGHVRGLLFGKDHPKFMNYGAIGNFIGHEMTHSLMGGGQYRGSNGTNTWYTGLSRKREFISRSWCLIDQYDGYRVDSISMKVIGTKTLVENQSDVGGLRLAHDAFERWAAGKPEEPKLRGLEQYSAKQMFWISTAMPWCGKNTPQTLKYLVRNEKHTVNKFRVIGMLANMPEFAKDFKCNATSLMNPTKRCAVWQG